MAILPDLNPRLFALQGYTCVDAEDGSFGPRCVFHWNSRRVPAPEKMFSVFNDVCLLGSTS
eukprot:m.156490 g.156490  ORF g.156490 m.156490 type:complete len:61 (-) comp16297_c0_seq5:100-282(-)